MKNIIIKPGDIFCTRNPMWLGRAICFVEKVNSTDNQAEYSHAGIFIHGKGAVTLNDLMRDIEKRFSTGIPLTEAVTFEALWTNKRQDFYKAYKGQKVLIGRHRDMTPEAFLKGWERVKKHEGHWYAGHRLFFFFIPFLAKYINLGLGVCSELTAKFIAGSGVYEKFYWQGKNPDHIADMIHRWKDWDVVYEGVVK